MEQKVSKVALVSKNLWSMFLLLMISACSLLKNEQRVQLKKANRWNFPKPEMTSDDAFLSETRRFRTVKSYKVQVEDAPKKCKSMVRCNYLTQLASCEEVADASAVFPEKIEFYSLFLDKDVLYLDFSSNHPEIHASHHSTGAAWPCLHCLPRSKPISPTLEQVKFLAEHEDTQVVFGHTYAQQPFSLKDL
jgi:Zn-finger domain-containing protein